MKNWVKNIRLFAKEINKVKSLIHFELSVLLHNIPYLTIMYLLFAISPIVSVNFPLLWSIMSFEFMFRLASRRGVEK